MKKIIMALLLFAGISNDSFSQIKPDAITGELLSEKKDSKFLIYKQGTKYFGRIIWGDETQTKDTKNPDPALRTRELIGLVILNIFSSTNSSYTH